MKRFLLLFAGWASLVLGLIGIFLPLLPTTPFLLLASACFLRSSDTLYNWLTGHPILGPYLLAYRQFGAISKKAKIFSVTLLWSFILFSALFVVALWWVKVILIAIALAVTIHILRFKTLTSQMQEILQAQSARLRGGQ